MHGLLIIDKPQGMTSHDVVRRVRRFFRTKRVGHTGTLDPMATGVLPVAIGEATKIVQFLMAGQKRYRATLKLGETTDTYDAEGTITQCRPVPPITFADIARCCQKFTGNIEQIPPMFSAIKKNGTPLHRLARQGIEVEREPRNVEISRIEVLEVSLPYVTLEVDCGKGTYIRSLAHDLGEELAVGAHLTALRRTRNGFFDEGDAVSLERLETASIADIPLLSPLEALRGFALLQVSTEAARALRFGIPPGLQSIEGPCSLNEGDTAGLVHGGHLLAVVRFAPGRQRERRGDFEFLRVMNQGDEDD
ncbi:tRNA pseudouridine(55) synthase TruB [Desulfuromonas sp. AOP6]|uniref:tRNA pseudouridine(55) synthase TruB n=1 Tax=Desulfuromonas sp. AOP6 TaxID=1566351 RepID=UPI001288C1A6|nr:tRNA pseudouridine(55) synthase TruB [Desulfuromonas sp. AOP6]BCA79522.1 tRNA pseudouridine synthase B [Desulfuromonas sp. AOP6]